MSDQPLVEAYLADLERALTGSDPRERAEVLESVREHLAQTVPPGAGPAEVRGALADLGSVEAIAAAVSPATSPAPAVAQPAGADWRAVGALTAAVVGAVLLIPAPFVALPVALVALVAAAVHLRTGGTHPGLAWTAVVVAGATLLTGLLLSLSLLSTGRGTTPVPDPVQTAPAE